MRTAPEFSIAAFEASVADKRHEDAARALIVLLERLQECFGQLPACEDYAPGDPLPLQVAAARRLTAAIDRLFTAPGFSLSEKGALDLLALQRWLAVLFGATPERNADGVLQRLNRSASGQQIVLGAGEFLKFLVLHLVDSRIAIDPEDVVRRSPRMAAAWMLATLSSSAILSEAAEARRTTALQRLPRILDGLALGDLPAGLVHAAWMQCSYAPVPEPHAIKRSLNRLLRRALLDGGFADLTQAPPVSRDRPVVLVILEWFFSTHVMYRWYAASIAALRTRFRLVAVSLREATDDASRALFDEVHVIPRGEAWLAVTRRVRDVAASLRPEIVYFPSVGMLFETCLLANLRLAPMQVMTPGHPASSQSPCMDYFMGEEDLFSSPIPFSETIAALPNHSMACTLPPRSAPPNLRGGAPPPVVRLAVTASVMKLNIRFLRILAAVEARSPVPVAFHFFVAGAFGLAHAQVEALIHDVLPTAVVHPHCAYPEYLANLGDCDLFLDPFPFGNSSSVVDAVRQGLPGVCLSGDEVFARADGVLFARMGLPEWTITRTMDDYVAAALRLANHHGEREAIASALRQADPGAPLAGGDPSVFAEAFHALWSRHSRP